MAFYKEGSMSNELFRMDEEDVKGELNVESLLVVKLLNHLRTYDCTRQRILALKFDYDTVLSEVLWQSKDAAARL